MVEEGHYDESREEIPETCPEPCNDESDSFALSAQIVVKKSSCSDVESQLEKNGVKLRDSELSDI